MVAKFVALNFKVMWLSTCVFVTISNLIGLVLIMIMMVMIRITKMIIVMMMLVIVTTMITVTTTVGHDTVFLIKHEILHNL